MNHYVYLITNKINGKRYIGKRSCKCDVEMDKYMGSGKYLKSAIGKYGIENFEKEIIKVFCNEEDAYSFEDAMIKDTLAWENDDYYNLKGGGSGGMFGYKASESTKMKHSNNMKMRWKCCDFRHKMTSSASKRWRDENFKNNISEKMKSKWKDDEFRSKVDKSKSENGYFVTDETRLKISNALKGRKLSDDTKAKISRLAIDRCKDEGFRKRMSESMKGRKMSDETRLKISMANKGRILSDETRRMISERQKGNKYWLGKKHSEETKNKLSKINTGKKMKKETIDKILNTRKINKSSCKKVVLVNNGLVFDSIIDAQKFIGLKSNSNITMCCKGQRESAGKINGEKAIWRYYEEV